MSFKKPDWLNQIKNFEVIPLESKTLSGEDRYAYRADLEKKTLFGIELARSHKNNFEAALQIFPKDTNAALWISVNWCDDPIVITAKEEYNSVTTAEENLLDKIGLSRKLLAFADEKIIFNGNSVFAAEAKDRLAALKLYADIQGFISKETINNTINNSPKFMEIKFVEPDKKEVAKTIEHESKIEDILEDLHIKLKLVG